MTHSIRTTFWLLSFSLFVLCANAVVAEETAEAKPEEKESASTESFEIPEDLKTAEELFGFVEETAAQEPEGQTEQEMIAHHSKIARTVIQVADKVLDLKGPDKEAMQAYSFKLQALRMLKELGHEDAEKTFTEVIAEARADERPDVAFVGIKFLAESGFSNWGTLTADDQTALLAAIADYIIKSGSGVDQLQLTLDVVGFLNDQENGEMAKDLLNSVLPGFRKSEDQQVQDNLEMIEGIARRINLPGNEMELSGMMLDGTELDWESYRGKVVLVDFWATWCGPCRAEVPNVLKLYNAYRDKGFDVLGISLDNTAEDAKSYIEQEGLPWATMFSDKEGEQSWNHPMARYYGIDGIPRAILVDREGKVVSMNARDKELARLLRKMLGEPLAGTSPVEDPQVKPVAGEAEAN